MSAKNMDAKLPSRPANSDLLLHYFKEKIIDIIVSEDALIVQVLNEKR
jgi:hypothetical protein